MQAIDSTHPQTQEENQCSFIYLEIYREHFNSYMPLVKGDTMWSESEWYSLGYEEPLQAPIMIQRPHKYLSESKEQS